MVLHPKLRSALIEDLDSERESHVIRPGPLKTWIKKELSHLGNGVIESHFTDLVPPDLLSHCIILRTHPEVLQNRLKDRKWSLKKIHENIQAEILGNCVSDVIQAFKDHKVVLHEVDTSTDNLDKQVQSIIACLQKKKCISPKINWLRNLTTTQLKKYFDF
jgi:adenylate kinase